MPDLSSSPKLSRKNTATSWVDAKAAGKTSATAQAQKPATKAPPKKDEAPAAQQPEPAPSSVSQNPPSEPQNPDPQKETETAPPPAPQGGQKPAAPQGEKPPPSGGTIKGRGVAALVSLFLPGVGLILYERKKMMEGAAVFVIAIVLDILSLIVAFGGGLVAGSVCCILGPLLLLGVFLIPVVHIAAAIHTYMRTG
ncbi:MAG: hypothetical protein AB1324_01820 [Candidatus Micrarchaeota archaeon]